MTALEILDAAVEWGQLHGMQPNRVTIGSGVYNTLPISATTYVPGKDGRFGQALALEWYLDTSLPSEAVVFSRIVEPDAQ